MLVGITSLLFTCMELGLLLVVFWTEVNRASNLVSSPGWLTIGNWGGWESLREGIDK